MWEISDLFPSDHEPWSRGHQAGVDEVGIGPLAGPVVAAAVLLDPSRPIAGLTDSKALTAKRREALAQEIKAFALSWGIGLATVAEIDEINILQASLLAASSTPSCPLLT